MTIAGRIIEFNNHLTFSGQLPSTVQIMNPFSDPGIKSITGEFYTRFFNDNRPRHIILGINPGRFGAGTTGIPFTDTIRLRDKCLIPYEGSPTYEPSSAFVYDMIDASGGVQEFYGKFLISAVCPLGFTIVNHNGRPINFNYYDSRELMQSVYGFILDTLKQQLEFGISRDACICLGTGRNEQFLRRINAEHRFFEKIIALEHPRYIMQYRSKSLPSYIEKYISALRSLTR